MLEVPVRTAADAVRLATCRLNLVPNLCDTRIELESLLARLLLSLFVSGVQFGRPSFHKSYNFAARAMFHFRTYMHRVPIAGFSTIFTSTFKKDIYGF